MDSLNNEQPRLPIAEVPVDSGRQSRLAASRPVKCLIAAGLALTGTGAAMLDTGERHPIAAASVYMSEIDNLAIFSDCPPPPPESELQEIIALFTAPPDAEAAATARSRAESAGLSFASPYATTERIGAAQNPYSATAIADVFTKEHLGFDTTIDVDHSLVDEPHELAGYKEELQEFIWLVSLSSTEFWQGIILDEVRAVSLRGKSNEGYAALYGSGVIKVDIASLGDAEVVMHEAGHAAHKTSCNGGNYGVDHAITDLNPVNFRYGRPACIPESLDWRDITPEQHGLRDVKEHTSELTEAAIVGMRGEVYVAAAGSPAETQAAIALHRIDQIAPGSAEYYADARGIFAEFQAQASIPGGYQYPKPELGASAPPRADTQKQSASVETCRAPKRSAVMGFVRNLLKAG